MVHRQGTLRAVPVFAAGLRKPCITYGEFQKKRNHRAWDTTTPMLG